MTTATPPTDTSGVIDTFVAGEGYQGPAGVPVEACGCTFPPEFLSGAVRRVRIASLGFAAVWFVVLVMNNLAHPVLRGGPLPGVAGWPIPGSVLVSAGLLLSLGMAWLAGRLAHRPTLLLDLGLGFLVLSAGLVGVVNFWGPDLHGGRISWIAAMILAYPAIAPNTPARTLWAGLAAASMDLVGIGIGVLRGIEYGLTPFTTLWLVLPNYICAVLAVIPAEVIRSLGQKVSEARELGSYRLERLLGRGGMGEVHVASHRMIARPAAIKFIRPELLGSTSRVFAGMVAERFRREAEAAAALRSPHTIELYDFGIAGDCTPYYVMELLDGIDTQTLVERFGPLPPERVIHLVRQVCDSLGEAHALGLVHRDIKPSNIHVCRMGLATDFVKVLDFGLVKRTTEDPQALELSAPGTDHTTGTPAYMAPELSQGNAPADTRTDLYALGCVAYWLLTGRLVFDAPGVIQMMYRHAHDPAPAPSALSPHPIPVELDRLVLSLLAKRPEERPATAEALADALARIPLAEPWTVERARAWWATHLPA